jgi:hypothetical protein
MKTKIVISLFIFLVSTSFLVINSSRREKVNDDLFNLNIKSSIENYDGNKITDKDRIKYLTYGRCSDYKAAEEVQKDSIDWFYRYKEHDNTVSSDYIDNSEFGSGITVRKCESGTNKAGYVMQGLISNKEQLKNIDEEYITISNRTWLVLPRIRINPDIANNLNLDTVKVFRLEVTNFDGKIIDSITIRARSFRGLPYKTYDGKYLESYFSFCSLNEFVRDSLFVIDSSGALNTERTKNKNCKVDYRIYWYGECDMYVDRIRVINNIAFDLMSEDRFNSRHHAYMDWIKRFAETESPGAAGFGLLYEKYEYNKRPVIKYINDKILECKEKNGN